METCWVMHIPFMYNHVMTICGNLHYLKGGLWYKIFAVAMFKCPTVASLVSSLDLHLDQYIKYALNIIWVCHVCPCTCMSKHMVIMSKYFCVVIHTSWVITVLSSHQIIWQLYSRIIFYNTCWGIYCCSINYCHKGTVD